MAHIEVHILKILVFYNYPLKDVHKRFEDEYEDDNVFQLLKGGHNGLCMEFIEKKLREAADLENSPARQRNRTTKKAKKRRSPIENEN